MLSIPDFDDQYNRCIIYGFKSIYKPFATTWGNRYAKIQDPFGHVWNLQAKNEILIDAGDTKSELDSKVTTRYETI